MVVAIKEDDGEPSEQIPHTPKNFRERCLKESSEASYFQICLAGLGAYPLPVNTRKTKDDEGPN